MARGDFLGTGSSVKKSTKTKEPSLVVAKSAEGEREGEKGKGRRTKHVLKDDVKKQMLLGVRLGMPVERVIPLCGLSGDGGAWRMLLSRHPQFAQELQNAKLAGEIELLQRVHGSEQGWQGSAWLLERARGYVARASMEHTGKGGSTLTIAHQLLSSVAERER